MVDIFTPAECSMSPSFGGIAPPEYIYKQENNENVPRVLRTEEVLLPQILNPLIYQRT